MSRATIPIPNDNLNSGLNHDRTDRDIRVYEWSNGTSFIGQLCSFAGNTDGRVIGLSDPEWPVCGICLTAGATPGDPVEIQHSGVCDALWCKAGEGVKSGDPLMPYVPDSKNEDATEACKATSLSLPDEGSGTSGEYDPDVDLSYSHRVFAYAKDDQGSGELIKATLCCRY